jgi:hypothetical protein
MGSMTATARTSAVLELAEESFGRRVSIASHTKPTLDCRVPAGRDGYTCVRPRTAITNGQRDQEQAGTATCGRRAPTHSATRRNTRRAATTSTCFPTAMAFEAHLLLPAAIAAGLPAGNQSTLLQPLRRHMTAATAHCLTQPAAHLQLQVCIDAHGSWKHGLPRLLARP